MTSDHASMTSDHAVDIDRHVRIYITVFVALMVLTIITVPVVVPAAPLNIVAPRIARIGAKLKWRELLRWEAESLTQRHEPRVAAPHSHLRIRQQGWDTLRFDNSRPLQRAVEPGIWRATRKRKRF